MTTPEIKKIQVKLLATMVLFVLLSLNNLLTGQAQINARFANPQFERSTRTYFLDVELSSVANSERLFGMNLRFFYDASKLEFLYLDQLASAYSILGKAPQAYQGSQQIGAQMFNFTEGAAYVNGAIQLQSTQSALEILPNQWTRVLRIGFKVPLSIQDEENFCPAVLFDQIEDNQNIGYLSGSEGLIIMVVDNDPNTPETTAPTVISSALFNWERDVEEGMPYGGPVSTKCISVGELVSTEDPDLVKDGYALYQNKPNPFDAETKIDFILPFAQQATLKFYDVSGKIYEDIKGSFKEGINTVTVALKPWMVESKVVLYRLETEDYKSGMRKMTLISK
jgi:hypothetical protein